MRSSDKNIVGAMLHKLPIDRTYMEGTVRMLVKMVNLVRKNGNVCAHVRFAAVFYMCEIIHCSMQ